MEVLTPKEVSPQPHSPLVIKLVYYKAYLLQQCINFCNLIELIQLLEVPYCVNREKLDIAVSFGWHSHYPWPSGVNLFKAKEY